MTYDCMMMMRLEDCFSEYTLWLTATLDLE